MPEQNVELIDYLRVFWKWKLLIILITVVCAITSGVVSFVLPKIYQSSAILEVGRVPRYRGASREQIEPIEDIESVSEVLESDEILSKIRGKFNLQTTLGGIRAGLDVEPILGEYIGSRLQARLIKITFEGRDPQLTVDVLNILSDSLIKQHLQEYQASIESVDEEINNSQDEISLQNDYQKVVREQIKVAEKAIAETRKELSQLNLKNLSPLEVLFLRSTLRDQEEIIADFHEEIKDVQLSIQLLKNKVVYLEHMRAVSENTKVRDRAVTPNTPIRPRKKLNTIIGGVVGFVVAIMLAFFFEYLQSVRTREREEAK